MQDKKVVLLSLFKITLSEMVITISTVLKSTKIGQFMVLVGSVN